MTDHATSISDPRQVALARAMMLFWARGAETAPYAEIVRATGLSRKSLYLHWPEKTTLVHETLELYRDQVLAMVLSPLQLGGAKGLASFWSQLESAAQAPDWRGCYMFRSGSGPLRDDPWISAQLSSYLDRLTTALAGEITAADPAKDAVAESWRCAALLGMISTLGAQAGWDQRVERLFALGRASCGVA